jgi:hypothetical protein
MNLWTSSIRIAWSRDSLSAVGPLISVLVYGSTLFVRKLIVIC